MEQKSRLHSICIFEQLYAHAGSSVRDDSQGKEAIKQIYTDIN